MTVREETHEEKHNRAMREIRNMGDSIRMFKKSMVKICSKHGVHWDQESDTFPDAVKAVEKLSQKDGDALAKLGFACALIAAA